MDAFEDKISSAVEDAVPKKIKDAIVKLDNLLQSFPKEVPVTSIAALNVTLVGDPALNESSLNLEIDGLFSAKDEAALSSLNHGISQESSSCEEADKMVKFSLHEDVLVSASSVYFEVSVISLVKISERDGQAWNHLTFKVNHDFKCQLWGIFNSSLELVVCLLC